MGRGSLGALPLDFMAVSLVRAIAELFWSAGGGAAGAGAGSSSSTSERSGSALTSPSSLYSKVTSDAAPSLAESLDSRSSSMSGYWGARGLGGGRG